MATSALVRLLSCMDTKRTRVKSTTHADSVDQPASCSTTHSPDSILFPAEAHASDPAKTHPPVQF